LNQTGKVNVAMIDPMLIPFAGIALPVVLVPVILGIRYARVEREMEHRERIRAMELGRTLPCDEGWWTLPRIAVAISGGVPASVFFCAWQASNALEDPKVAWIAAGIVGLGAVVCGSALAGLHYLRQAPSAGRPDDPYAKAPFDADAFDVAGSRG
jgi:hypothetical protein